MTAVTAVWSASVPELSLTVAATGGDSRDLLRSDPGGLTLVASGLGLDAVTDRHAPLGGGEYVIRVWSGASTADEAFMVAADPVWGNAFVVSSATAHAAFACSPSRRRQAGRQRYVRSGYPGRTWGREVVDGSARSEALELTGTLLHSTVAGQSPMADWESVQADTGTLRYRDPEGANWPASVSLLDESGSNYRTAAFSFTVTRIG